KRSVAQVHAPRVAEVAADSHFTCGQLRLANGERTGDEEIAKGSKVAPVADLERSAAADLRDAVDRLERGVRAVEHHAGIETLEVRPGDGQRAVLAHLPVAVVQTEAHQPHVDEL